MMPSSVKVGVRPSIATNRSYSCRVSPCSATSAGVMTGSPGRGVTAVTSGRHSGENGFEQSHTVIRSEQRTARALWVRHHAEHISPRADDPGDVALRAVGVGVHAEVAVGVRIPEDNASFVLELFHDLWWRDVSAIAMGDRHPQDFPPFVEVREHRVAVFNAESNFGRNELQM